ncbi:hypothetical protein [Jannaschia sp. LMIT008]|uniref:hypothetical protein n=1 Tax=Jannaschia maritima TaxID=3032585 RepID=UPI0028112C4E|nr:hypothetical protein [Jannaschia sp. LMIT008]
MLRITRKQQQAHLARDDAFAEWYVEDFMQFNLPRFYHALSAQGKREMTINGRHWARLHGFEDAEAQGHFITLMWEVGADFFRHEGFRQIAERDGDDMARIDAFYEIDPDTAATAIQNADDRYWYPVENGLTKGDAT